MLQSLFGCKSIERILLYLLVNEKCHAHGLHRMLGAPLTPIQKALLRLEKGGVIRGKKEGKAKIYQFNPDYPLSNELQMLLKRAFNSLPLHEKKEYFYVSDLKQDQRREHHELLQLIFDQLQSISRVNMAAKSSPKKSSAWEGKGSGTIDVQRQGHVLIFNEQGSWKSEKGPTHSYKNSFRWTWNRVEGMLSLEHLRFGTNNPVFLFYLIPTAPNLLESFHSHLSGEEIYFGWLRYSNLFLQFNLKTLGPAKNEEIEYIYT